MTADRTDDPMVLIIEDQRPLADHYAECLDDDYGVLMAYSGAEGIERLTDDVGVILLARNMPLTSGNEIVAEIEEAGIDCRIAFLVDESPDGTSFLTAGIDTYLVRPINCEQLRDAVSRLLCVSEYTDHLKELTTKKLRRNVLELEDGDQESDQSDTDVAADLDAEIDRLEARLSSLEAELDLDEHDLRL